MQTRRHGQGWSITSDSVWTDNALPGGTSSRSMANMVEVYQHWTVKGWGPPTAAPMVFDSQKLATDFAEKNRGKM